MEGTPAAAKVYGAIGQASMRIDPSPLLVMCLVPDDAAQPL